jgi:hypothetical protein
MNTPNESASSPRVTASTTLQDIEILRGQLGVTQIKADYETFRPVAFVAVMIVSATHTVIGRGETLWESLDDAFCRLAHRVGEDINKEKER